MLNNVLYMAFQIQVGFSHYLESFIIDAAMIRAWKRCLLQTNG